MSRNQCRGSDTRTTRTATLIAAGTADVPTSGQASAARHLPCACRLDPGQPWVAQRASWTSCRRRYAIESLARECSALHRRRDQSLHDLDPLDAQAELDGGLQRTGGADRVVLDGVSRGLGRAV